MSSVLCLYFLFLFFRFKEYIGKVRDALKSGKLIMYYNRDVNLLTKYHAIAMENVGNYLDRIIKNGGYASLLS